jgi:hypothetical protein
MLLELLLLLLLLMVHAHRLVHMHALRPAYDALGSKEHT